MQMSIITVPKNRLPFTIRPLPPNRQFFEVRRHRQLGLSAYCMQNIQCLREAEICQLVEKCHNTIRQYVENYFNQCNARVLPFVEEVLLGRKQLDQKTFATDIFSSQDFRLLEQKLSETIRKAAKRLGSGAFIYRMRVDTVSLVDLAYSTCLFREYQRTMLLTEAVANMGNRLYQESIANFNLPMTISRVVEQLRLADMFLHIVGCSSNKSRERYRAMMIKQLIGILDSIHCKLVTDVCRVAAERLYDLYDLMEEINHERKAKQLKMKTG